MRLSVNTLILLISAMLLISGNSGAMELAQFNKLQHLIDSARVMSSSTFAPKSMKKAEEEFMKAREAVQSNRKQKTINKHVAKAAEFAENALKAAEVAKLTLKEYLQPRDKAIAARSASLVQELYFKAETQFVKAAAKVEKGDVKGGLKDAAKSIALYDVAELEAIRKSILGSADAQIVKAKQDGADKFALSTFDKARTARAKANAIISNDRYDKDNAKTEAKRSEYEARHASNIALSVRALKRNDQAWEKLMLIYEIQLNRVGVSIGAEHLPFDNGPMAAADSLIHYINAMQTENEFLTRWLSAMVTKFGDEPEIASSERLIAQLDSHFDKLMTKHEKVFTELKSKRKKLSSLETEHQNVTAELGERQKHDEKFRKAKSLINPSEGEVLFNSSNDVVLRLSGISFDIGKAYLKDSHIPLLEKVNEIVKMFPEAMLMVEGHTDATGDGSGNMLLSEKRAYAVMQYLRQSLLIPAARIKSMGFGSDKPVASNKTKAGRAMNRRIDIIIMQ